MGVGVRPEHAPQFARRAPPAKMHDESMTTVSDVPADVVGAALRAAESLGRDVADVPLIAIAREAGMSRSTLVRRLNGSRQPLDDAVRAAGVEPGGRPPVRERAVQGAAVADQRSRAGRGDIGSGCGASGLLGTQPVCGVRRP